MWISEKKLRRIVRQEVDAALDQSSPALDAMNRAHEKAQADLADHIMCRAVVPPGCSGRF